MRNLANNLSLSCGDWVPVPGDGVPVPRAGSPVVLVSGSGRSTVQERGIAFSGQLSKWALGFALAVCVSTLDIASVQGQNAGQGLPSTPTTPVDPDRGASFVAGQERAAKPQEIRRSDGDAAVTALPVDVRQLAENYRQLSARYVERQRELTRRLRVATPEEKSKIQEQIANTDQSFSRDTSAVRFQIRERVGEVKRELKELGKAAGSGVGDGGGRRRGGN